MKAIVLAAGYGTRLQRDIEHEPAGEFRHLRGIAKPLLPIGHRVLLSHWLRALTQTSCVDTVVVVTNALYHEAFQKWAEEFPSVKILNDGTRKNEERLGAVACLQLAVKHFGVDDHIIVIGGDTLFKEDFSLGAFTERFAELQRKDKDSNLVLSYQCKDDETLKYGILEVDSDLRVQCMKEKPRPTETNSRSACPCFYLFSRTTLPLLDVFLKEKEVRNVEIWVCEPERNRFRVGGKGLPLHFPTYSKNLQETFDGPYAAKGDLETGPIEERDAPGNFLSWLILRRAVYVYRISGRFDVGNLPSYIECDKYFKEQLKNPELYLI